MATRNATVHAALLFLAASLGLPVLADEALTTDQIDAEQISAEQIAFFEIRIRPVLVEHCYKCHSERAKKLKGGLRLDFRDKVLRGGDSGPAIVVGKPDESLLIQAVRYDELEMPPKQKLPDQIIADLVKWVEMGAPDPRDGKPTRPLGSNAGRNHWAFQPVERPALPDVEDEAWPLADVDFFTLNRLEREGLKPVGDADRYTWLRRVSFDLTGLPPTLQEIESFVADASTTAHEKVVDRMLRSRAFAERWSRHWLDLVGYADQKGTQAPIYAANAWRYRDYVMDSLNEDMPYDHYIRQQIAGDLMPYESPEERRENLIATGYLVLGDLPLVEADKVKLRVDVIDLQVGKIGKAFLGLTLRCARCHDHKFDPVSQDDYYALAGMFYSTSSVYKTTVGTWSEVNDIELPETEVQRAERIKSENEQAEKLASLTKELAQAEERVKELNAQLKEVDEKEAKEKEAKEKKRDATTAKDAGAEKKDAEEAGGAEDEEIEKLKKERGKLTARINGLYHGIAHAELFVSQIPLAHGVYDIPDPTDMRITIRGNARALGATVPRGVLEVMPTGSSAIPDGQSGRLQLADWIASPDNPLTARVVVNRIWQKLIGAGLHRNVDYFGLPEEPPSHPELLDYLASSFVRNGWSRKKLIRSIVLGRTYRMSSHHNDRRHEYDPENRLIWRMNRSRMDAEALRDALISASGTLQRFSGGPTLPYEIPENVTNIGKARIFINLVFFSLTKFRPEQQYHRTVYLPVVRGTPQHRLADLRNVFDFTPPALTTGQRSVTTVPTQTLFLMNSPLMKKHAESIAERVEKEATDEARRLELLWLYVLNRPVTEKERLRAAAFLSESGEDAWTELCHALIASNEFLMRL